jgi:hypothetical protein
MAPSRLPVHVPRRDHPKQPQATAQGEGDVQQAPGIGPAEGMKAHLRSAVARIRHHEQRVVQKDLLRLALADPVPVGVLARIVRVPVEPFQP